MPEDSRKLSGAEEFVAIETELTTPLDPDEERGLREALGKLDPQAFDSCDIEPGKISLCYDPTRTSQIDLLQLIRDSGGRLGKVESEKSPLS